MNLQPPTPQALAQAEQQADSLQKRLEEKRAELTQVERQAQQAQQQAQAKQPPPAIHPTSPHDPMHPACTEDRVYGTEYRIYQQTLHQEAVLDKKEELEELIELDETLTKILREGKAQGQTEKEQARTRRLTETIRSINDVLWNT